jgi:hypothetical protein
MQIEIYFDNQPWSGMTACYIVMVGPDGKRTICKPMRMEFEPLELNGTNRRDPSLEFGPVLRHNNFFEALVAGLARAGYKQESNDIGELTATKKHLEDFRKLIFHKENITSGDR